MYWKACGVSKPLAMLLLILTAGGLTACETASVPSGDYCLIAHPITGYEGAVTDPAVTAQIEQHNSDWVCACEDDCQ